jgi:TonB family protein
MSYIKEHKNGLIGTLITHGIVLALLLLFGFFTPLPLPGEEGILVNFGNSDNGLGAEEPAPGNTAPEKNQEEKHAPARVTPPPPQKKAAPPVEKEEVVTQSLEKTAAIPTTKKKKTVEKSKEELEKERILREQRRQEQLDRRQKAEEERVRQAEIERKKKEEEQRLAIAAAEQRRANEINNMAKNAFGGAGKGEEGSKSTSQGVTYGGGNQGSTQGTVGAPKYGPGGGVGNGVSFSLSGRSAMSLPKPYYPGNEEGVVVVQVTVDQNGAVTKAEPGYRGSNTADPELIAAAKKAALQAKFNVDKNAPAYQVGTITYRFVLN